TLFACHRNCAAANPVGLTRAHPVEGPSLGWRSTPGKNSTTIASIGVQQPIFACVQYATHSGIECGFTICRLRVHGIVPEGDPTGAGTDSGQRFGSLGPGFG